MNHHQRHDSPRLYDLFLGRLRRVLRSRMPLHEAAERLGWTAGQTCDRVRGDTAIKLPHLQELISKLGSELLFSSLVDLPTAQGSMPSVLANFRESEQRSLSWLDGLWDLLAEMAANPPESFVLPIVPPEIPVPLASPARFESVLEDPRSLLFPADDGELDTGRVHQLATALALWAEEAHLRDGLDEVLQAAYLLVSWAPHPKLVTKLDMIALRHLASSQARDLAVPAASPCALRKAALDDPSGLNDLMDLHLELELRPRARGLISREASMIDGDSNPARPERFLGQLRKHVNLVFGSMRSASLALGTSPSGISHWLASRYEPSLEQYFQLLDLVGLHPFFLALALSDPAGHRAQPDLHERLHLCSPRRRRGPFRIPAPSSRVERRIAAIRSAPRDTDRKLYALLDLCSRQQLPQDRIAVLRELLRETDSRKATLEACDLGVLEALASFLLDSDAADDALDLGLSVLETGILEGGKERLCWSLACISDCLARLGYQHEAKAAAQSALSFLEEAPPDSALELSRRIHYRLAVQFVRIGRLHHARRHFRSATKAHENIDENAVDAWQVRIPWIQGLLDSKGVNENAVRALRHLKAAEDSAFRQRLGLEFCHVALQRLQIALDLGSRERLREMIVDSRTKALVLLDELPAHGDLPERFCSLLFARGISVSVLSRQVQDLLDVAKLVRPDQPALCPIDQR